MKKDLTKEENKRCEDNEAKFKRKGHKLKSISIKNSH